MDAPSEDILTTVSSYTVVAPAFNEESGLPTVWPSSGVPARIGDSEVVVYGWEASGTVMLERLRGMFAFALWDERQETLLLARDPLGIKSLYWAWDGQGLTFESEMKALLCARAEVPLGGLDPSALQAYLCFG